MVETTGSQAVMPSQISGAIDVPLLLLAAVVLNFCVHSVVCADEPPESLMRIQRAQYLMGTEMGIVVYATDEATADRACIDAFKRIRELEESLSDYDAESELSLLSKASPTKEPVRCSDDLWLMLETSYQLSERTEGAFDITVGPLSKLWRVAKRQKRLPRDQDLQAALPSVGYRHLKLHPEQHSVELTTAGMQLDLGSIAKGYASDEALKELAKHGFKRAFGERRGWIVIGGSASRSVGVANRCRRPRPGGPDVACFVGRQLWGRDGRRCRAVH